MLGGGPLLGALAAAALGAAPDSMPQGTIAGIVVNASDHDAPVDSAHVVLRVSIDGQFAQVEQTLSDRQGHFRFERLPIRPGVVYLAGANRGGVHYPGPRVRLTPEERVAKVRLVVCDTIARPNPLVIRRQEVTLRPQPGGMAVTETMVIANPTAATYVGEAAHAGGEPVTLRLAIPADFERVTFDKEFFGRRFFLAGGKLVTGIPWPPGERTLRFRYVIPTEHAAALWKRPLDLPCSHLQVVVATRRPEQVVCNLPSTKRAPGTPLAFETRDMLPAGHEVRVELRQLPRPLMTYARWVAVASLLGVVVGGTLVVRRRRSAP